MSSNSASENAVATGSVPRPKTQGLALGDAVPGVPKADPILVIDNVTRRFGGLVAVDVDHLEIPRHAITALIGPNGAGKTTLFNLLCGFDKPNTGTWELSLDESHPNTSETRPARLGVRFGALVIDAVAQALPLILGGLIALGLLDAESSAPALWMLTLGGLGSLAVVAYQVSLTAREGVTIGKRALGLRVLSVTTDTGTPIGWARTILRTLILLAPVMVLGIGLLVTNFLPSGMTLLGRIFSAVLGVAVVLVVYLSPLWDKTGRNHGWHDKIVGSEVFEDKELNAAALIATGTQSTPISGVPSFKVARMGQVRTFQLTKALSLLTVLENMKLGARGQTGETLWATVFPFIWRKQDDEIENKAMELLARFKLDTKADDYAASLSGGQRKLLEMARALMSDPTLVMLDEPMAGVNPALTQSLLDHVLDLKDLGMTVLFVEHDMHMVRHIADWVVVMAEGRVVAEGPPETVMQDQAVIDAYLGSHQDVDLGIVTGRIAGELDTAAMDLLEEIREEEAAAIAEAEEENR